MKNKSQYDLLLPASLLVAGMAQLLLLAQVYVVGVAGLAVSLANALFTCGFIIVYYLLIDWAAAGLPKQHWMHPVVLAGVMQLMMLLPVYAAGVTGSWEVTFINVILAGCDYLLFLTNMFFIARGLRAMICERQQQN